ncbi:RpiB/LacA/LacB family sugar-phosphate isomerase [Intrasporangium sp.]|uniref:RpiB/LacA/LacB family sugar-phosphate isomerase n=1 Tax=Intrasporangium sp. TaxID=1925024 RepID=UPI00322192B0
MRIAVASDHVGKPLREHLTKVITELGHEVVDFGTDDTDPVSYCDRAFPASEAVANGECDRAVLVCGGGIGMALAANKVVGIRAAAVSDAWSARLGREHQDLNVIAVGAGAVGPANAAMIVTEFLTTEFEGGRFAGPLAAIAQYESR